MAELITDETLKLSAWLIRLCKWCWHVQGFFFGTVLFSILLNLVAALPLVDPSTLKTVPIAWIFSFWPLFLSILVFFGYSPTNCMTYHHRHLGEGRLIETVEVENRAAQGDEVQDELVLR